MLLAGEISEDWTCLRFRRLDESVLAFTDPADVERIEWDMPRSDLTRIRP